MIYFIADRASRAIKIGYSSRSAAKRLSDLQTGNPRDLELAAHGPGDTLDERRLHDALRPYRLTGEWFRECAVTSAVMEGYLEARESGIDNAAEQLAEASQSYSGSIDGAAAGATIALGGVGMPCAVTLEREDDVGVMEFAWSTRPAGAPSSWPTRLSEWTGRMFKRSGHRWSAQLLGCTCGAPSTGHVWAAAMYAGELAAHIGAGADASAMDLANALRRAVTGGDDLEPNFPRVRWWPCNRVTSILPIWVKRGSAVGPAAPNAWQRALEAVDGERTGHASLRRWVNMAAIVREKYVLIRTIPSGAGMVGWDKCCARLSDGTWRDRSRELIDALYVAEWGHGDRVHKSKSLAIDPSAHLDFGVIS